MPTNQHTVNISGPFRSLDKVERVLEICETKWNDQIRSIADITSIPSIERLVLLVQFANGLKIKLSVSALDHNRFEENKRLLSAIGSENFSRVLVSGNGWAAFEWIEGATLRQRGVDDKIVRQAAQLLTTIHNATIDPDAEMAETTLKEVRLKLEEKLSLLVSKKVISDSQSQTVLDLCSSITTDTVNISLIHADFSPDNLVVRGNELYSVDNDKIRHQFTDYDVCRAVSLWDEWNLSGGALLDAYREVSRRSLASESLFFWGTFDLIYRISYRISSAGEFNQFCIDRLRQILTTGVFR